MGTGLGTERGCKSTVAVLPASLTHLFLLFPPFLSPLFCTAHAAQPRRCPDRNAATYRPPGSGQPRTQPGDSVGRRHGPRDLVGSRHGCRARRRPQRGERGVQLLRRIGVQPDHLDPQPHRLVAVKEAQENGMGTLRGRGVNNQAARQRDQRGIDRVRGKPPNVLTSEPAASPRPARAHARPCPAACRTAARRASCPGLRWLRPPPSAPQPRQPPAGRQSGARGRRRCRRIRR